MSIHSSKFYEELILEQANLMESLKSGNEEDVKANTQALTLINNMIKYIYKYNQYQKSKLQTVDLKQDKKIKSQKTKVTF